MPHFSYRHALRFFLLLLLACVSLTAAFGGYVKFKNEISKTLYIAVGYNDNNDRWVSEGWYTLRPGETKTLISNNHNRYVYWYAEIAGSDANYEGYKSDSGAFCIDPLNAFTRYGDGDNCRGTAKNFRLIDRKDSDIFTLRINSESKCQGNCWNGKGTFYGDDGEVYTGGFRNGEMHGFGEFRSTNGAVYRGDFKARKMDGFGELTYPNGSIYKGDFKDDKPHGSGTTYWKNGHKHTGKHVNGVAKGWGAYYFSNGDVYRGNFSRGKFHGEGTYYYASGDLKPGLWSNGMWKYHGELRLVLIINNVDYDVKPNGIAVRDELIAFYRQVAQAANLKFRYRVFDDGDFEKSRVVDYLEKIDLATKNDALVVHYFGHGYRNPGNNTDYPDMLIGKNRSLGDYELNLTELKRLGLLARPRLGLFFADCCNASSPEQLNCPSNLARSMSRENSLHQAATLFVEKRGSIIASSSSRNELSFTVPDGSSNFNISYLDEMQAALSGYATPTWGNILDQVSQTVYDQSADCANGSTQTPQYKIY